MISLRCCSIDNSASAVIVVDVVFMEEAKQHLRRQEWVEVTNNFDDAANLCNNIGMNYRTTINVNVNLEVVKSMCNEMYQTYVRVRLPAHGETWGEEGRTKTGGRVRGTV